MNYLHGKLFPKFWEAVVAMDKCCEIDRHVLAKSEVYNETWMLRLTLARIYDYDKKEFKVDEPKNAALKKIRDAVRKCWISEGGLEPAFEKEGTTWTDAILGDVTIGEYDDGDGDKRKVKFDDKGNKEPTSVVIVEAKMGSSLSKSVTNSADYDQAARNIACLSKLLLEAGKESGAFFVFMPDSSRHNLRTHNFSEAEKFISNAITTIQAQNTDREISIAKDSKKPIAKRNYWLATTHQNPIEKFSEIVKHISKDQSMVLTWDEIIDSMYDTEDKTLGIKSDTEKLRTFYEKALDEIRKQTTTSMRNA